MRRRFAVIGPLFPLRRRHFGPTGDQDAFEAGRSVLSWSERQNAILTGGGVAEQLYIASRGFPYTQNELPHYHVLRGNAIESFRTWRRSVDYWYEPATVGMWYRPLFAGGFDRTTSAIEDVANAQTPSVFVDVRVPRARRVEASSLETCELEDLRILARQHAFAGYTRFGRINELCSHAVRHHLIDWNLVGEPRSRPNKWRIEPRPPDDWKEWSWATDDFGQSYYVEHWRIIEPPSRVLALVAPDCVLCVLGNRFSYAINRRKMPLASRRGMLNCAQAVDAALARGDRADAQDLLSIDAGHGIIERHPDERHKWTITLSLQPWHQGHDILDVLFDSKPSQLRALSAGKNDPVFCMRWPPFDFVVFECIPSYQPHHGDASPATFLSSSALAAAFDLPCLAT